MTDQRIRALERSGRATGDRLAWLAARQRAGNLDQDGLELAAFMGDPAARALAPHVPLWNPMRDRRILAAWGGLPAVAGCLALLRAAIERFVGPVPERVLDLAGATAELLAAPSEGWLELIESLPQASPDQPHASELESAATRLRTAVEDLPRWPLGSAHALGHALGAVRAPDGSPVGLPEQDRCEARAAIARRALASPLDPAGPLEAEGRWLEERVADFWITRRELLLLHEEGHRPAGIALGTPPVPQPASLEAWIERLLARGLDLPLLADALVEGIEHQEIDDDSVCCAWCEASRAREEGRTPEEVVAIRYHGLVRAAEAGTLPRAELDLFWKRELAREGAVVSLELEDLLQAAEAVGPWLARKRIAAAEVARLLHGPTDKNFGRHARRRRRRAQQVS